MLSLRGNRDDSHSDSDDGSYSSFDESMENFRVADSRAKAAGPQPTAGGARRQHDFLKRDDDNDENSSDGLEDTNIVSRLQRSVDAIDNRSYELMAAVRSRDWRAALGAVEELKRAVSYVASQGARVPYAFLSALKFTHDFFDQPADDQGDALARLRQETPKELRKTLSDFHREIRALCEERAQQIERMDDEDSEADEASEDSDVDLEEMLKLGGEGPAGETLDETLAAAVLGGKDGFSLSTLLASQELSEASIINKVQELRLKLAGGISEKSSKDSDKRLKRMKRSRSVLFSLAMQSILREVEAAGRFPRSQALLCALLFADCFGERRQGSVQRLVYKDLRALGELFPSMRLGVLATIDEAADGARHTKHQRATLRQWLMAAEYLNRYLSVLECNPDVAKLVLSNDESNAKLGIDMSISLLLPFTLAARTMEEYVEAVRATELHEATYLGWLRVESVLLFVLDRTLRLYIAREPRGEGASVAHLEHTLHLSDNMLFLLHYRLSDVHEELYDRYYSSDAKTQSFVKRDLTASIAGLRGLSQAPRVAAEFPSIALRSSLYLIHHHAANGRVEEATRLFRTVRCDEQVKALASHVREANTQRETQTRTRVAYNRVLAVIATALFQQGKAKSAGEFLMALYVPQAQPGSSGHHSIYTKELLLAQLSLRHGTAIRFSAVPSMEGTGNSEPAIEHRAVQGTLERFLLPAWKTAVEDVYLPPHLHLNVELIDCIFFVYCMLYQESTNRRGAYRSMNEPRVYRAFLNSYERQSFLNDPVTNKDLVYAAVVAFRTADWQRCCDRLHEVPLFRSVLGEASSPPRAALLELTTTIKTECLKKFMLGARGVFANVLVGHLSTKFTLPEDEVRRVIAQMVVRRELYGAFSDETEAAFVFDHAQHTPLQKSILQLSEKVVGTIDCAQRAQEYKHVQKLYTYPESFGKGAFFYRGRHRGRGKGVQDGPGGIQHADENRAMADGSTMAPEHLPNTRENRRVRGGTIRNAPLRNPFATLRGNRFVSR